VRTWSREISVHNIEIVPEITVVIVAIEALLGMRGVPALRTRVEERVRGLLEIALELRKLPGGGVDCEPLLTRVDHHEVRYSFDLANGTARIVQVVPIELS
jgi:hypothetical protein